APGADAPRGEEATMPASASAHPHALPGTLHAPAGMLLPGAAPADAPRADDRLRNALDVAGGVAFAFFVGIVCMRAGSHLIHGRGWLPVIGWESVWLVAAMLCSTLMPSGIRHDISWRSTLEGLKLDWPELAYGTWVFGLYTAYLGELHITAGPLALALAVGTAEEFIFRVLLLGWLVSRLSAPAALTVSAVAFGAAHLHELSLVGILSVVPQTAGGFVLGAVYLRTRNPLGPILAHAFWDLPYFIALGAGVSGGGTAAGIPAVVDLVPWMAFAVYGLWLVRHGVPVAGRVDPVGCTCAACTVHAPTLPA
ncbi:MAG: family intrarane metalloprotease, partial [Thermoleophilia bacterium]|nr:family intrarane metalloprotease [Thermoleophilia bacterium]